MTALEQAIRRAFDASKSSEMEIAAALGCVCETVSRVRVRTHGAAASGDKGKAPQ